MKQTQAERRAQEELGRQLLAAREAGGYIRFFLDGGNDTNWTNPQEMEDNAIITLSKLEELIADKDVFRALIDAAGFQFTHTKMGTLTLAAKARVEADAYIALNRGVYEHGAACVHGHFGCSDKDGGRCIDETYANLTAKARRLVDLHFGTATPHP